MEVDIIQYYAINEELARRAKGMISFSSPRRLYCAPISVAVISFTHSRSQGSFSAIRRAVDLIRQYQKDETHYLLRSEFSIIEGKEEFVPYPSQQKAVIAKS